MSKPRSTRRAGVLPALLMLLATLALPGAALAADAKAERLADLVVKAIPLGAVFDTLLGDDPAWPMQEKPDAVTPGQLACLRGELSSAGYRRAKRQETIEYLAKNPGRADADIAVLDGGAAELMGKLMLAGAEQERTGNEVDQNALMASAKPEQLANFMSFMTAPDYAPLRRLAGIGDAFDSDASAEANEARGEDAGADLATRVMLGAMSRCDVPSSVLF